MFEKNLYTLCALLSLSCSAYAIKGETDKDESASSSSVSIPGPSSALGASSEQETDKDSSPTTFIFSSTTLTIKWSDLLEAANNISKEDHQAQVLLHYLLFLRAELYDLERDQIWQNRDPEWVCTLPLSKEDLDAPYRQLRNGSLLNPLVEKYGSDTDVAIKIATIIGFIPTTKEVITEAGSLLVSLQKCSSKQRKLQLKNLLLETTRSLEVTRQEKEDLSAELERLKVEHAELKAQAARAKDLETDLEKERAESQRLRHDFEGVADRYGFKLRL